MEKSDSTSHSQKLFENLFRIEQNFYQMAFTHVPPEKLYALENELRKIINETPAVSSGQLSISNSDKIDFETSESELTKVGRYARYLHKKVTKLKLFAEKSLGAEKASSTALEKSSSFEEVPLHFLVLKAKQLSLKLNNKLRKELEELSTTKIAFIDDYTEAIEELKGVKSESMKRFFLLNQQQMALNNFPVLVGKYTRTLYYLKGFGKREWNHLQILSDLFKKRDMGEKKLGGLVREMYQQFKVSIEADAARIQNFPEICFKHIQSLQGARNDDAEFKLRLFKDVSLVYWALNNPFELHVGLEGISAILQDEHELAQLDLKFESPHEKYRFTQNVRLLHATSSDIETKARAIEDYDLILENLSEVIRFKTEMLQKKRRKALKEGKSLPTITIMGGGPAGLSRLIVAGLKGAPVQIIEKRPEYLRKNMIELSPSPIIDYLGVYERLFQANAIYRHPEKYFYVKLQDLEKVLKAIATEIFGNESFHILGKCVGIESSEKKSCAAR